MSQDPGPEERVESGDQTTQQVGSTDETHDGAREQADYGERILRRSRQDRVIAGVSGGLGRYLEVDPAIFRVAFILSLFAGGIGLLIYIVLWIAVPEYPSRELEAAALEGHTVNRGKTGIYVGGLFVLVGVLILLRELVPWFDASVMAALVLIGIGAAIVIRGLRRG